MGVFVGVDVGTGSARAGVFDGDGQLLGSARRAIAMWHEGDFVEQSSDDVWAAVCDAVRRAVAEAGVAPDAVDGVGFDATCSLVLLGDGDAPLAVGAHGDPQRNIIVWMDHRAMAQTRRINATGHDVLRYVGGAISPEMQTPKLLWLKENLPASFDAARQFLDLSDFLTYRATGSRARSVCTVTCKWTYLAHEARWSADFFRLIGLQALADEGFRRIGTEVVEPGTALGAGLTAAAAADLGLRPGTAVGAALIDAHAGGFGSLGAAESGGLAGDPVRRIAYIMGTSACIMASTPAPTFVPGVWGPYYSAMVPGLWLNEGGQSAAGAGIDQLVRSHPAFPDAETAATAAGVSVLEHLENLAVGDAAGLSETALLAAGVHVLPDYLGNRSPAADPGARAVIAGLDLESDLRSLSRLYVAGLCGLGYGMADVADALQAAGIGGEVLVISGGASRSPLVRQLMADATGLPVALPATPEPILLGSAMLAALAAGAFASPAEAMSGMSRLGPTTAPTPPEVRRFHAAKRRVHARLKALDRNVRADMASAGYPQA